jgi:hypothetical protein
MKMKCPKCSSMLRKVDITIPGAKNTAIGYQCQKCSYLRLEPVSCKRLVDELSRGSQVKPEYIRKILRIRAQPPIYVGTIDDLRKRYEH